MVHNIVRDLLTDVSSPSYKGAVRYFRMFASEDSVPLYHLMYYSEAADARAATDRRTEWLQSGRGEPRP